MTNVIITEKLLKKYPKIIIVANEHYDIVSYLEGSIDSAIEFLQRLKSEGWTNLDCESGYDRCGVLRPQKQRLETDEEQIERIKRCELSRKTQEENERKQYEILKKKFENIT